MRYRQEHPAIRSGSIVVIVVALAAIVFVLRHNHSKPLPAGAAAAIAAVTAEPARGKLSAEEPPVTLIDLPSPSQRDEVADSDASGGDTFTIPVYAARAPINSALLAAQQLAAQRAAFIATGSPGLAMPAGLGAGAGGAGVASAQSANATSLELGLLSGGGSNGSSPHSASSAISHSGWVLIAGGQGGGKFALTRAELFDPIQMNFVATGAMHRARAHFVAADLAAGQMLVAGGDDAQGKPTASAELYDPITGQFSPTGAMTVARAGHTATLISGCGCAADGKILIAGGSSTGATAPLASAELYDPDTGSFATTGAMNQARAWQTASPI
ncbi:MAG: Kelch repeat-containing protein, partial [Pseudomonadota bacterium]